MTEDEAIHICRNPYGHSAEQRKEAKLVVCDQLESMRSQRGIGCSRGSNPRKKTGPVVAPSGPPL